MAQSEECLTQEPEVQSSNQSGNILSAVVSYWRKYVHLVLVNPLGGLSLSRN